MRNAVSGGLDVHTLSKVCLFVGRECLVYLINSLDPPYCYMYITRRLKVIDAADRDSIILAASLRLHALFE